MSRFHECFARYVANPVGETLLALSALSVAVKGIGEGVEAFRRTTDLSDIMEVGAYAGVAGTVGTLALIAAKHYRDPNSPNGHV